MIEIIIFFVISIIFIFSLIRDFRGIRKLEIKSKENMNILMNSFEKENEEKRKKNKEITKRNEKIRKEKIINLLDLR